MKEVLVKGQGGQAKDYREFLLKTTKLLRPFLRKRLRDKEQTEDVLQEVLLSVHRARHTYDPGQSVFPWLYAIARHRLIDFVRREKREKRRTDKLADEWEVKGDSGLETFAVSNFLHKLLQQLPGSERRVIELMKMKGFSAKETGEKLKMSESAVKVAAFRAVRKLRTLSQSKGGP